MSRRRRSLLLPVLALGLLGLTACIPALREPGDTSKISLVATTTVDGWTYQQFRNTAYPCAVSGYQTFTIATKDGSSARATRPLWVRMHGGGVGYFDPSGRPRPGIGQMTEERAADQRPQFGGPLIDKVRADPAGFRLLTVSMCSHDLYGGPNIADPNNPNTTPDGTQRTVNGLVATKAAIQFAQARYPTNDFFLHGGSAGSVGSTGMAWSLQQQGIPPAGVVADSGTLNLAWHQAVLDRPKCGRNAEQVEWVPQRIHPDILDEANQPAKLVADGRLTVPILDVFSSGDAVACGAQPVDCPLPNGSTVSMGSVDCNHEHLRQAIAAQGAGSRSLSMRLCVSPVDRPGTCDIHTPTSKSGLTNTLAPWPADYTAPILTWVHARMADD